MSMPVISALDFTGDQMVDETRFIDSPMKRFYQDKTVFITGGTGFLGQLFIEKLLRCKVKAIYVLARSKKNKTPAERIEETFNGELFVKLKLIDPNYMTRIRLIEGDAFQNDLGISDVDRKDMIDNVEIVIHSAADVRFDKPLQQLCYTNVRATKVLTDLAEEMKKLVMFAYVSTAFSQYYCTIMEEKFYPPPLDPDEMIRIAEHFEKHQTDELNILTDKLLDPWQNTYVFTKSLAEEVVRRAVSKIPVVIIRPSIIISTFEDPIPGWTNNLHGLNGMTVGSGMGFIKVSPCNKQSENNVICADFVTNGTLAAIWDRATEKPSTNMDKFDESKVIFNITSQDPLSYGDFNETLRTLYLKYPSTQSLTIPYTSFTNSRLMFIILTILYHAIPGVMYDVVFKMTNNKFRLLPIYRKSQDFLKRVVYFVNKNWNFENKNMKTLIDRMSEEDKAFFQCDHFNFNLREFCYIYMLGLRTYVVKEPLNNYDESRKKMRKLYVVYYSVWILYCSFLAWIMFLLLQMTGSTHFLTRA